MRIRAGRHAEEACFGIDRPQPAVGAGVHPGDVVAHRPDLVTLLAFRRDQHGEIGLAASARERRGNVGDAPVRLLDADDQHVFGQPAFLASHVAAQPQGEALLAQQGVSAIARSDRPDRPFFREVHDEAAVWTQVAQGMQPLDVVGRRAQPVQRDAAHARHDPHVGGHVRAVGDLDADLAVWRTDRSHDVGHDVQGAALHRALEQRADFLLGLGRGHPVVVGAGVFFLPCTDEGEVFGTRDVFRVAAVEVAVGVLILVQRNQGAVVEHVPNQPLILFFRTVTPMNALGMGMLGRLFDPVFERSRHGKVISLDGVGANAYRHAR